MEIVFKSREFSKVEIYRMTKDAGIVSLTHVPDDTQISVESYMIYVDKDMGGNDIELLSIMTTDGKVYACVSDTFKDSFVDIYSIFAKEDGTHEPFTINKISGESKSGRKFINCTLVY